ncbi:MAG: tetratricopeptide repeat protein [Bryobacteraceae bacterium]
MDKKKVITIVVPLLIGGGILFSLRALLEPKSASAPAVSATGTSVVPPNAAHEKASLEEELRKNPGHPPILLRLAELASSEGKAPDAIRYLRQAVEADPKNADARLELGRALHDTGDIEGAIKETTQLVKDHPDNVDGLYNLGAIYANQGKNDLARQYWNQAVVAGPASESGVKAKDGLAKLGL